MRIKLFVTLALMLCLPALAGTGLQGVVIDSKSGLPVAGITVMLDNQGATAISGANGNFIIGDAKAGADKLIILGYGYKDWASDVTLTNDVVTDLGIIRIEPTALGAASQNMGEANQEMQLTASQLEDEEGNTQAVAVLSGSNDNPFNQAASYNFSIMRFRVRGYNPEYSLTTINGVNFNDAARGRFNYSMLGGLNQAFKNRTTSAGLEACDFTFGDVGGVGNINTFAKDYAPGFRGSVAYTNSNYRWRGMATYSTGLMSNGWAMTLSAVGRYANEGIIPGSFYNSWGYFFSAQKVFNPQHSIAITTFGAPTKRASNSATFEEAYKLAGSNLYNSNWGWQEGKKRNARVVEAFDPTVLINWIWKPSVNTTLNTAAAFHKSFYASSALNWYNARDPRPDYYRYLPSYYEDPTTAEYYRNQWLNNEDFRQINWGAIYNTNLMNNYLADQTGTEKGSTYILENRHSNLASWTLSTNLNTRINSKLSLQGGYDANYSISSYYKTMKDLLGGRYWTDVDQFAERDFPSDPNLAQNDLSNPGRRIGVGDRFGYDYNINQFSTKLWLQNMWSFAKWDANYSVMASYTTYQRDGKMQNGRAPQNSLGKGERHNFVNWGVKGGLLYKLDGRNNFALHAYYGTKAPLSYNAYVSPRIKDDVITNLHSERIASADLSYNWNYRIFKGVISAFYTDMQKGTERTAFYDDLNSTFMNYALTNVHRVFKGVELGASLKLTPSVTLNAAANLARYQYKNRPTGTRSYENGSQPDVTQTVYLKNFYVGGTPQEAYCVGLNYAAPHMWFFEVNACWINRAYINLSPIRHEKMDKLWTMASTEDDLKAKIKDITTQEKFNEAFVVNMSIGHVIYLNRRASLNFNLSLNNLLNNTNIQTGGYQQGRFDYKNFTTSKYPNKYYYAQGFKMFLNVGVRF